MANNSERGFAKDHEKASEAGRKGGQHSHGGQQSASGSGRGQQGDQHDEKRGGSGNFANDRERASEAGRKGGKS